MSSTIEYRPALDGLRAYAVLVVVLFHAGQTSDLTGFMRGGGIGVSVFFTLSGYLVTTLVVRQAITDEGFDVAVFWSRRARRLVPVSLVVVLVAAILASSFWPGMRSVDALAGIFGFSNWNVIAGGEGALLRTIVGPLGPFWSLAVEEQFYMALTIAVVVSWRTARPIRTLSWIVGIGWLASLLVQLVTSGPQYRLEFGTDSRGSELLAGCGLALLLHVRPELPRRYARHLTLAGSMAGVVLVVLAFTADYDPPWLLRGGFAGVSVLSALLVSALLENGPLARVMGWTPVVMVGRLSYSWYVVHWPTFLILTNERVDLERWPLLAVKVAISFVVAVLVHVAIEQPLRRLDASPARTCAVWGVAVAVTSVVVVALL